MKYRKDIDGLRGIAVLAVVINHAAPDIPIFESGFIGVDMFFVISGYLITTIIINDLDDNRFSFKSFWARRIRRILPTLILMLSVMVPLFYSLFGPYLQRDLLRNTVHASTFTSNFSSNGEADYFGAQLLNPLLHLWSLAIEEQFYLFWPIICFLAFKIAGRKVVKIVSVLLLLSSFVINLFTIYYLEDLPVTFYFPHTRVWELMAGAILAQFAVTRKVNQQPSQQRIRQISSMGGILLLVIGFLTIRENTYFPGYWALLPVIGTVGLIFGGSNTKLNNQILSNPIIGWFGTISYALYLWHFPLLFLLRQLRPGPTNKPLTIFVVVLSIIIAWLTTKLLEIPIRFGTLRRIPSRIYLMSLVTIGTTVFSSLILISEPNTDLFILEKIEAEGRSNQNRDCLRYRKEISVRTFIRQNCFESYMDSRPIVFLVGDSHSASLRLGLKPFLDSKKINLIGSTVGACMFRNFIVGQVKFCRDINNKILQEIEHLQPDLVVIDFYWAELARSGSFEEYLLDYIAELNNLGVKNIVVVGQIPTWGNDLGLPRYLINNFASLNLEIPNRLQRLRVDNDPPGTMEYMRFFKYPPGVTFISMDDLLCNEKGCLTMVGPKLETDLIVWDYGHLTPSGALFVSKILFADIEKLLAD